jgi:hypothetical protein
VSRPSEPKARVRASSTRYGERRAGTQCKSRSSRSAALGSRLALRLAGTRKASDAVGLKQDEFRLAPPLNEPPLIPAKAGIQAAENSAKEMGPRVRGDERNEEAIQTQLISSRKIGTLSKGQAPPVGATGAPNWSRQGAAQIANCERAATAPCGQYAEGCLRAASNIARHLSYSGVPGLSVPVRHFCSSVCACANCCDGCDDDAHPAKVRANTIADTSFI